MSLSATYDPILARVRVAVTQVPDVAGLEVWVERSTDGIAWTAVRGAAPGEQSGGAFAVDDYEFPPGVLVTYRARTDVGFVAASDSFTRTVADSWGTADVGGAWAHTGAVANFDVAATFATYTGASALNTFEAASLPIGAIDVDVTADITCVSTPTGGPLYVELLSRWSSAGDVFGRLTFTTAGAVDVSIIGNNGTTILATAAAALTGVVGVVVHARLRVVGTALKLKVWTGSVEPGAWTLEIADVVPAVSGGAGMRFARGTGNTNVNPVIRTDKFQAIQMDSYPSATVTAALAAVWLKSIARPFLNRTVTVHDYSDITRPARGAVFEVIGRRDPVAVTEVRGSRRFDVTLRANTRTEVDELDRFLSFGDVVLLQPPAGSPVPGPLYAYVGDVTVSKGGQHQHELRFLTLPLTEVAAPDAAVVGYTATIAGIVAAFATCADVLAAFATCQDLLEYVSAPEDEIVG